MPHEQNESGLTELLFSSGGNAVDPDLRFETHTQRTQVSLLAVCARINMLLRAPGISERVCTAKMTQSTGRSPLRDTAQPTADS
jgi:hypothetical protein